ncbi:MAG TPA: hypothetical protein DIS90_01555 [Cytophagales bacterium]|nr:hypothetical protein [Cytophagales bacterium]
MKKIILKMIKGDVNWRFNGASIVLRTEFLQKI